MSGVELRTSGTSGPSMDIFISISTWLGSRRHCLELRIRFSVEKDLSTVAVPIGSNSIFCAKGANVGKRTAFSGVQATVTFNW